MSNATNAIWAQLCPSPEDEAEKHRSISANLRHAQKQLCRIKREAENLQRQHLEQLLNEARAANRCKKSTILQHLIRAEQNRRCYQTFRQHTKLKLAGGLAYITTMDANTGAKNTILDHEEMDTTLLEYSRIILVQRVLILPAFLKINSSTAATGITCRPAEESRDDHDNFDGELLDPSASYHYNDTP